MTEREWMQAFGDNLKYLLEVTGISQYQLANEIGVNKSTISKYISGTAMPSIKNIVNISYVLHCTIDSLVDHGEYIW